MCSASRLKLITPFGLLFVAVNGFFLLNLLRPVTYAAFTPSVTPTPNASPTCWHIVKSQNIASSDDVLNAVVTVSATDVWSVGSSYKVSTGNVHALIEHWNGTSWSIIHSPNPLTSNSLSGVAAISAGNVWAVGGAGSQPLIEHWNGTSWSIVPGPGLPSGATEGGLTKVVHIQGTNQLWAVGSWDNPGNVVNQPLIEHWDGMSWSIVDSPSFPVYEQLNGIAAFSVNDAWAVGEYSDDTMGRDPTTLIEHWDGTSWSIVSHPEPPSGDGGGFFSAVAAVSAKDAWVVGVGIEHWDGTSWSIVPSPSVYPDGVAVISASNVWAVASDSIEHWDGTQWSIVPSPNPLKSTLTWLTGVARVKNTSQLWTVGFWYSADHQQHTLTEVCS